MLDTRNKQANDMKSFEYLSVRYWSEEVNGTGCGFGPRSHHHLDHTLPTFKK